MNIFKKKLFWMTPILVIVILLLLAIAFIPAYNPEPKSVPIAIVNQDKGTTMQDKDVNIGKTFADKIKDNKDLSDKVEWVDVDSKKDLKQGFKDNKYYGALILDENLSKDSMSKVQKTVQDAKIKELQSQMKEKIESGQIPPEQAKKMQEQNKVEPVKVKQGQVEIIVNEGSSMQGAQLANTMLTTIGDQLNTQISKQAIQTLDKMDVDVSASDIQGITNPIKVDKTNMNAVKSHQANGNLPLLMFTPVWLASLVGSVVLFFSFRTSNNITIKDRIIASLGQLGGAIVTALIGGFGYIYFMTQVLDVTINEPTKIGLYISIAILAFISLILGFMTWLGVKAIPLFMVLLFFSLQLIMLPTQMLPQFYQEYMIGWNPFRHYAETLRGLLYLHLDIELNSTMWMFIGFIIFGGVSAISAAILRKHSGKRTEVPS
ncbi:phage infection protein [Mammaliicoccus sciuri]|uniref:YhgE/Pip domain-containing protein n=1 Tax=Mammaliicoccus sciuri TaxID=1296 RepID=UPI000D1F94F4|nr:ABC transporter permease [Mammaliicoccus sciuri]PTJ50128.1 phage infection protein [Mammaliicoccus sciuri]PTJ59521.1 phage infection protein [Mammaliicoccus sciuri]RIO10883.1 phage infection protein [Mammaliicoccus sciuri]